MSNSKLNITDQLIQEYLDGKLSSKAANALERRALIDQELSDRLKGHVKAIELKIDKKHVKASLDSKLADRIHRQKEPKVLWWRTIGIAASIAIIGIVSWWMIDSIQKPDALAKADVISKENEVTEEENLLSDTTLEQEQGELEAESKNTQIRPVPDLVIASNQNKVSDEGQVIETDLDAVLAEAPALESTAPPQAVSQPAESVSKARAKSKTIALPSQSVKAKVVDELDDPLPGVVIRNKANGIQRTTDVNGEFEIPTGSPKDLLQLNYIGFESKELEAEKVDGSEILLENDLNSLSEIVVTGAPSLDQKASPQEGWRVLNEDRKINSEENGKIQVSFEIDEQGHLNNIQITKSFDPARNAQVLEILNKYDQWNPELANGKPVKSKKKLTFKFLNKKE